MKQADFAPGFRLSVVDVFVLVLGTAATIVLSMFVWCVFRFFAREIPMSHDAEVLQQLSNCSTIQRAAFMTDSVQ